MKNKNTTKYDRSLVALVFGIFFMPFFICFMFYLIALSQENILTWQGFISRLWFGPYFAIGGTVCLFSCGLSLYWLKTDINIAGDHAGISEVSSTVRISHSVVINDARWQKFISLGVAAWLDKIIDEA